MLQQPADPKSQIAKDEYYFLGAKRGKFLRPNLKLIIRVHLEPDVLDYLSERAYARRTSLGALVNA